MRFSGFAAAFLFATGLAMMPGVAPDASAQGIRIGPGGVQVDPGFGGNTVDRGEAVGIARRRGLVDVDRVSREGRRWVVEGSDRRGRDMEVEVDSRTGEVLSARRY